ncbi:MAG: hypothetical protein HY741_12255 [Chloroflexi bacterium]|nr:hypothetical protein [Chloroflexota bacterium]
MPNDTLTLTMWRADKTKLTPVKVECPDGLYPHNDADGEKIFNNTHFETEEEAWAQLRGNVLAWVEMAGAQITQAEFELQKRKDDAANAAKAYDALCTNYALAEAKRRHPEDFEE